MSISKRAAVLGVVTAFMLGAFFSPLRLGAATPGILSYQGRVLVSGLPFPGPSGQFKFALVNAAGTTTFWSNDNTSVGGSEPTAMVSLPVTNGLYSVLLGDTTIAGITQAIPATVFDNADVRLRIWFNDGTNGSKMLTPDQRIAPVGYAQVAKGIDDGAVTTAKLADQAVTGTKIANATIGNANIAAQAITQALLGARSTGTTVGAGGIAIGASTGNFGTTDSSNYNSTGSTVTITTTGRPVFICVQSADTTGTPATAVQARITVKGTSPGAGAAAIAIYRGSTNVGSTLFSSSTTGVEQGSPVSGIMVIDIVPAGTYTYDLRCGNAFNCTAGITNARIVAFEL